MTACTPVRTRLHHVALAATVALLWCAGRATAGAVLNESPEAAAERQRLEALVEARLDVEAPKRVDRRAIAARMGLVWPVKPPGKTTRELLDETRLRIAAAVEKKLPDKGRSRFVKEAEEKYALHALGDSVRLVLRGGVGAHALARGRLQAITPERVRIGSRWVLRTDIGEDAQARLYPEVSQRAKERYIRVQDIRYDMEREKYRTELERAWIPSAFRAAGYVPRDRTEAASLNPDDWVHAYDVLEQHCEEAEQVARETLRTQVENQIYTANHYDYDEELGCWVPTTGKTSLGDRARRLLHF